MASGFDGEPEIQGSKQCFTLSRPDRLERILAAYGFSRDSVALHVNLAVLEEDCCKTAFLRGAFLAGGSVTDPAKGYHLEMSTTHRYVSRETYSLVEDVLGVYPKLAVRGGQQRAVF